MVRRCWINFQCRGVLLTWITIGQGPIVLAVGAGGGCLDIFSLIYHFSFLSPALWETARYRLKYCLKGPLSPKQPTNHLLYILFMFSIFHARVSISTTDNISIKDKPANNKYNNQEEPKQKCRIGDGRNEITRKF